MVITPKSATVSSVPAMPVPPIVPVLPIELPLEDPPEPEVLGAASVGAVERDGAGALRDGAVDAVAMVETGVTDLVEACATDPMALLEAFEIAGVDASAEAADTDLAKPACWTFALCVEANELSEV
jgi:hypothetical protein